VSSGLLSRHVELDGILLDRRYGIEREVMMLTLRLRITLRQLDPLSFELVHRSNVLSV
jgi:hypothetical protein